ncbi:MAG TPA: GMP/IMP nucleotidase [Steroidobacteraceae bacterium]|nr:GMP/IMP nucleotidase [Steroidobacteraceae bacterium]
MPTSPSSLPDWGRIDTVLLDMDGTILDLKFDNTFWRELVPARFAAVRGLEVEAAKAQLRPVFAAKQGTLDWYCIEYWSRELDLDLPQLKREAREQISWLPEAERFVRRVRALGKRLVLVTNAHTATLAIKEERLDFRGHFDAVYSSHRFGAPKESAPFWSALLAAEPFDRERTLFVDDSLPVLRAARDFGIAWIYAIARPDTGQPRREIAEFPAVNSIDELMPEVAIERRNCG